MNQTLSDAALRLEQVRTEIRRHSPHPEKVEILGACKAQSPDRVQASVDAGLTILGNNYAQEGVAIREKLPHFTGEWHFIGHVQSRKAKELINYDCLQSVSRLTVAQELNRRLEGSKKPLHVLVEINLGNEESKSGISAAELPAFLDAMSELKNLTIDGLMGMPPPLRPIEARRPYFKALKDLFDSHGAGKWRRLSMGTSGDYPVALEEGATLIRLGTLLFGERPAK